jgi:hypothetical protein
MSSELSTQLAPAAPRSMSVGAEQVTSRQMAEVQAAMAIAKRFPRDVNSAIANIDTACKRPGLASEAIYSYSKGGSKIEGPSIRLAEVLAQNWGNIDFGWVELDRYVGEDNVGVSVVMAYAWDLQTNTRRPLVFNVRHWRDTRGGGYKIEDERDIYELNANMAARRMRTCILNIIPGDVCDLAVATCNKTLAGQTAEPIEDAVRKMVIAFKEYGVTVDMLARRVGCNLEAVSQPQLATLRKIFTALKDGVGTREQFFDLEADGAAAASPDKPSATKSDEAAKKLAAKKAAKETKETAESSATQETKRAPEQDSEEDGGSTSQARGGDEEGEGEQPEESREWREFVVMRSSCHGKQAFAKLKKYILEDANPARLKPAELSRAVKLLESSIEMC